MNRRKLLASLGLLGGSAVWSGYHTLARNGSESHADETNSSSIPSLLPQRNWKYSRLDPQAVGNKAYEIYHEGGCMYALVGSVIGTLADLAGEPFRSFPIEMMRFGSGGVGDWGSLCGVVNGASALIGLFHQEKAKETRQELIAEFCTWYEQTPLPRYEPLEPQWVGEADPSVAGSVLCHISVAKWCQASAYDVFSIEKKERCQRLAADGAMKIVEILNRKAADPACEFADVTADVKSCVDCHGERELKDAIGKMSCGACHQFEKEHPTP